MCLSLIYIKWMEDKRSATSQLAEVSNSLTFHGIFHILGKKTPHHLCTDLPNSKLLRKPEGTFRKGFDMYQSKGLFFIQLWAKLQAEKLNITDASFTLDKWAGGNWRSWTGLCGIDQKNLKTILLLKLVLSQKARIWMCLLEEKHTIILGMWSQCPCTIFPFLDHIPFFFSFALFSRVTRLVSKH